MNFKASHSNTRHARLARLVGTTARRRPVLTSIYATVVLAAGVTFTFVPSAQAVVDLWQGGASGTWLTAANWANGLPGTTDITQFGANGTATTIGINFNGAVNNGTGNEAVGAIDITSARTVALTLNNSSTTVAGTLTLNGATVTLAGATTLADVIIHNNSAFLLTLANGTGSALAMNVALNDATNNIVSVEGAGGVTISSVITGASKQLSLTGGGTGALTLSGANTFTGGVTVGTGILQIGAAAGMVTGGAITNSAIGTGTLTLGGGATLRSDGSTARTINNNLSLGGAITLGATSTYTGTLAFDNTGLTTPGAVLTADTALTLNVAVSIADAISGSFALSKLGTSTLTFSGANTFTGPVTVGAGSLSVATIGTAGAPSNLGTNGTVNLGSTTTVGTLVYTGTGETTAKVINLNGTTFGGTITQSGASGALKFTSDLSVTGIGAKTFTLSGSAAGTGEFAGKIGDSSSGATSLTKSGTGIWTLSGLNTYTGGTFVGGGTLRLGVSGAILSTTALTVGVTGGTFPTTFDLAGFNQTVASLQFNGGSTAANSSFVTLGGGTLTVNGGVAFGTADGAKYPSMITGAGALDLAGAVRTFTVYNHTNTGSFGGDLQISSIIQNGGISKVQGGILTLSGANTYAGGTTLTTGGIYFGSSSVVSGGAITSGPVGTGLLTAGTGTVLSSNAVTTAGDRTINNNLNLSGAITLGNATNTGILTFDNRSLTTPSAVLSADTALTMAGSASIYDVLSGSGRSLSKAGTGYLELAGVNTFSGSYTNSAGITYLDTNGALGSVSSVLVSGGTLTSALVGLTDLINDAATVSESGASAIDFSGGTETIGSLAGASTATIGLNIGDYTNTTTSTTYSGSLTVGGNNNSTTYSGVIAGVRAAPGALLTKTGTGTFTLSGANTFTGSLLISAGTLQLGAAGGTTNTPLGTIAGGTTVGGTGATLDLNGFTLGTAEPLTLNGTGISSGGALSNSSTTTATYSGLVTLGSNSSLVGTGGIILSNTGTITGSGFALTLGGSSTASSITSLIGTGTGTLTKTGSGTWTLAGATANTFTGLTTVSQGTLSLGKTVSANAIGGDLTISGGTVSYGNSVNEQIADTSNVTLSSGTFDLGARAETVGSLAMSGGALNKAGTGIFTINAASSITGGTVTLSAGTSQINVNGTLALGGATFNYTSTATPGTGNGLALGGDVTYAATNTAVATFNNTNTGVGRLDLGGATRTFNIAIANTLNGVPPEVQVGWSVQNGGLTKSGTGTLVLSAANGYTGGTTVNGGTLLVNGGVAGTSSGTGTGTVTVNTGALLGGSGVISGAVTVNPNGTIQGGTSAAPTGALTLSSPVTLNTGGSIIQLFLGAPGAHSTLATAGASFDSTQMFTFANLGAQPGFYDNIITGLTSDPGSEGSWTITNGGFVGTFAFDGAAGMGGNIDLTITAVPEPATLLGGALLAAVLGYRQRRSLRRLLRA